jgi:hypothetical protein
MRKAREHLAEITEFTDKGLGRLRFTKHGRDICGVVSPGDLATLQALDRHPELKKRLAELEPTLVQ